MKEKIAITFQGNDCLRIIPNEVIKIYNAMRLLECQLFPTKKKASCENLLEDMNKKINASVGKIENLSRAPS